MEKEQAVLNDEAELSDEIKNIIEGKREAVESSSVPVTKNSWYRKIIKSINDYLDRIVTEANKLDPKQLGNVRRVIRSIKIKLLSNPESGQKSMSELSANKYAKFFKRMVPETRNKKLATLFIIVAGLFTTLGILINMHRTHHIIAKRKSRHHKNY